ncbi:MAG: Trm112 family protein [Granulosicoccus sp.]
MDKRLLAVLVCPVTKGKLIKRDDELWSRQATLAFPIRDGIPVLIEEEARSLSLQEVESVRHL